MQTFLREQRLSIARFIEVCRMPLDLPRPQWRMPAIAVWRPWLAVNWEFHSVKCASFGEGSLGQEGSDTNDSK